ncbi:hypothetical protein PDIG_33820 [Penicillium digitatum PHI26]|uniref:Uncharacterized protein n=2 Tax=Penicillium digitatum TaxID=36651 RepID=K9GM03_PEND2|nr:hypothetical protein PDIP_53400 [Penicillium digitatum Pd1]EKV12103.1 hypothetical protein PDIP_53400 [Penicillium digitatum Pd1]EKV14221.1 hypothetical protein PDIG_33820 [Penicillium digitatum PHI26]
MTESTTQSSADVDKNMRLAVEQFRTKMEASYRQFLQVESMSFSTEEEKLKEMCIWLSDLTYKCTNPQNATASPEISCQSCEEGSVI